MPKKIVSPDAKGKYKLRDKQGKGDYSLKFIKADDQNKCDVEEFTDNDFTTYLTKIPDADKKTPDGTTINWIVAFNVIFKSNKKPVSDVDYEVEFAFDKNLRYWIYDGALREVTDDLKSRKKIKFNKGDPGIGWT